MNWDFSLILVILTLVSGIIWAVDSIQFAPRRRMERAAAGVTLDEGAEEPVPLLVDYARSFFPIFLIVLLLRSFLVEPFRIPSASMVPTLLEGDFILVNKFTYGIRLPVVNTKIIDIGSPQRGDVMVFRPPHQPQTPYIKRVIGVPGDTVSYRDHQLYVNGQAIGFTPLGTYVGTGASFSPSVRALLEEDLLGVKHQMLHDAGRSRLEQTELVVPDGYYFMMGDNRDNSLDSRAWGLVPDRNLIGKAFMIWMHWEGKLRFDFGRIGTAIR
ncbi:MAG: signal peptidase I [Gammaproteobacteria bacterium]|nr:signal peptidase I [Gammaproteobacteria bacterium]